MIETAACLGLLAAILCVADTVPYVRDTVRRSTVPHRGTWLIWSVLAVIAAGAHHADGAHWSLVPLVAQAVGTSLIFVLSIWLGSGGLSRSDLVFLGLAGLGVAGWLSADAPFIATVCVIGADLVAALMMVPKTCRDPHSETLSTYVLAAVGGACAVGAVGSASPSLMAYPVYFTLVNAALAGLIAYRRTTSDRIVAYPRSAPRLLLVENT